MLGQYFKNSMKRGLVSLVRRPLLLIMMVAMPLLCAWFLLDLMNPGRVSRVPVGIVDLDNSSISRNLTRNLGSMNSVSIEAYSNFDEAKDAVQSGKIMGFFYIPADFSSKALSGRKPKLSYYINYAWYTPASTQYQGFKTITVLANGAIAKTALETVGLPEGKISASLQPIAMHVHEIGNPWTNYSYYLNMSFVPCLFALFVLLVTAFSIGTELKYGTSREWLRTAGNSIEVAVTCKMLPQTVIFWAVGLMVQFLMFKVYGMPLNGNPWHMITAMLLFVLANQGLALAIMCMVPNFRYGSTLCTLFGMLSFSFCGFSLPQESMYPWVEAIGFVMPVKYYFLISVDQALNGIPLYYSRVYYAALLAFTLLPWGVTWHLRNECREPVYVP